MAKNFDGTKKKNQKFLTGFTLIEIIVTIALLALLLGLFVPNFYIFRRQTTLDAAAQNIVNGLNLAQTKTLASEGANNFGVYFETNKFTLFKGTAFDPNAVDNEIYSLNPEVKISQVSLNDDSSAVVFARLTGATENDGSIRVEQTNDASSNKTIFIDASGVIGLVSLAPSDEERIKDSRHVHVLYSQNTKNAVNLALVFPQDNVTQNISYQSFLNSGKTEFLWKGSIDVAGAAQKLKIHTHQLSETATIFCLHRDRRDNSKALQIGLDGQNIINYTSNGTTTPGASVWAGAPEIQ